MARIRTIKPDAFTSDTLSEVSVLARWTFAGLWTYCDDDGRGRYDPRLIKAALFPIDDATTTRDVTDAIGELCAIGAVCIYDSSEAGKAFLHCPKWFDHQRVSHPAKSKIPPCSRDHESPPEDLGSPPETLRPERKGKERNREAETATPRGDFPTFWAAYPRKADRGHADKAYAKAVKNGADPDVLLAAASAFAVKMENADQKFIPYGATWLNGERWLDEDTNVSVPDDQGRIVLPPLPKGFFEQ